MENEKEIYGKSCGEIALEDWRYTVRTAPNGSKIRIAAPITSDHFGRIDMERYEAGIKTFKNFIPTPSGPLKMRRADYLPLFSQRQAEMRRAANRISPPRWHRYAKRACLFVVMALLSTIFMYACVDAVVREGEFNDAIRKDRCLNQNLSAETRAGYCKGIQQ